MEIGLVGLGRMGGNMARRWIGGGHRVVGHARSSATLEAFAKEGLSVATTLDELVSILKPPRALWLMLPSGAATEEAVARLSVLLSTGAVLVDGGNTHYKDDLRRAASLAQRSIHYLDQGTSGGIWGLTEGYCLMIGGPQEIVDRLRPAFVALAPSPDRGWGRVGPVGAGHF